MSKKGNGRLREIEAAKAHPRANPPVAPPLGFIKVSRLRTVYSRRYSRRIKMTRGGTFVCTSHVGGQNDPS